MAYPEDTLRAVGEHRCEVFRVELHEAVQDKEEQGTKLENHGERIEERALLEPPHRNERHQYYQHHGRQVNLAVLCTRCARVVCVCVCVCARARARMSASDV